jgi:HK97 family phage major capsid protein
MTILEKREAILNLRSELETLINAGETEKRELNETETGRIAEIRSQIDAYNTEIEAEELENRKLAEKTIENKEINKSKEMAKEIRLVDLVNAVANGNVSEEQRSYIKGNNTINYRTDIQAGVATAGQENVAEDKMGLDVAIRNASVLNKMGCTWFSNAKGDISIPKYSGSQVGWKGEIVAAADGAGSFSETLLQPKRLTAYVDVSRTFLAQDSNDAEAILIRDLAEAVAEKLDQTVFGAATGDTATPAGLFAGNYTVTGTSLSGVTYDNVLALEEAVEEHNGNNFVFIAHPKVKYALKGTQMASGLDMVFGKGEIDGYKAIVSNSVNSKSMICMDPRDLAVANWNGIEIQVDTVTRAIYNEVRLVVNYYVDAKLRGDRIAAEIFS